MVSALAAPRLAAVLFDMDGLLVDTEPQWFAAEQETVRELGGVWDKQQQADLLGSNLDFAADYMIAHTKSRATNEDVKRILSHNMTKQLTRTITLRPGASELLDAVRAAGIPAALVTSSIRAHVELVERVLPASCFAVVVTADDVERLKPDPMPYLHALRALQVPASSAIVLEDSPTGVIAAESAGCRVVAVPSVVQVEPAPGRTIVASLLELSIDRLQSLIGQ